MDFTTINIVNASAFRGMLVGPNLHTMPSATTIKYAAKRVAEVFGFDVDDDWILLHDNQPLPDDDIIATYDGMSLLLGVRNA